MVSRLSKSKDILEKILPLFIIFQTLNFIQPDPQKLLDIEVHSIILKSLEFIDVKKISMLYTAIKAHRNTIINLIKKEDYDLETRKI
jgi:hypothetical protein